MNTQAPCERHTKGPLIGWTPVDTEDGRYWCVAEVYLCSRCDWQMDPRIVRGTIKRTQREALEAYGISPADLALLFKDPEPPAGPAASFEVPPLSCWPFPVSTRYPVQAGSSNDPGGMPVGEKR